MYTATMTYNFRPGSFEEGCKVWEEEVFNLAKEQPGFIRMQLLVKPPQALAMGTWSSNSCARKFMETGVFKRLMARLETMVVSRPEQTIWDLKLFAEK